MLTMSQFNGLLDDCTHVKVVRVFDPDLVCRRCKKTSSWGWMYRCVQDRESMIEHGIINGNKRDFIFDPLGHVLANAVQTPRKKSKKESLDSELSRLASTDQYTDEQLNILENQRRQVRNTIRHSLVLQSRAPEAPWNIPLAHECKYLVCPACRPSLHNRSFLSLNGILAGDVPGTAATGFGFHTTGSRPVVNGEIWKDIGCRRSQSTRDTRPKPRFISSMKESLSSPFLLDEEFALDASIALQQHEALERAMKQEEVPPPKPIRAFPMVSHRIKPSPPDKPKPSKPISPKKTPPSVMELNPLASSPVILLDEEEEFRKDSSSSSLESSASSLSTTATSVSSISSPASLSYDDLCYYPTTSKPIKRKPISSLTELQQQTLQAYYETVSPEPSPAPESYSPPAPSNPNNNTTVKKKEERHITFSLPPIITRA